jgi:hypothetical protein
MAMATLGSSLGAEPLRQHEHAYQAVTSPRHPALPASNPHSREEGGGAPVQPHPTDESVKSVKVNQLQVFEVKSQTATAQVNRELT